MKNNFEIKEHEYYIEYYKNKYIFALWIVIWSVLIGFALIPIINLNSVQVFISNISLMGLSLMLIIYFAVILYLAILFGIKLFKKSLYIKLSDNKIDINIEEIIVYINEINNLKLEVLKHPKTKIATGYILCITYNLKKKFKINIFTGTSEKEITNCERLLKFYNDLLLIYEKVK